MYQEIHPFSVFARRDLHNPDEAISCYLGIMGQSIRTLLKTVDFWFPTQPTPHLAQAGVPAPAGRSPGGVGRGIFTSLWMGDRGWRTDSQSLRAERSSVLFW